MSSRLCSPQRPLATAFQRTEHAASLKGLLRVRRHSRRSLVNPRQSAMR
jgi:hypothetical protein